MQPVQKSYTLSGRMKGFIAIFTIGALAIGPWVGVSSISRHDLLASVLVVAWFSFALPFLFWNWFLLPWRIEIHDDALCFVGRLRTARFTWHSMIDVRPSWFDINRQWLRWSSDDGVIWTSALFVGMNELLRDVKDHAPQVDLHDL